ncbi:prostasin isoform X2 [Hemicordylus capensis]|uniref:prostasin isoform X2 n=1 Tax=Hemicordylus capensis TaxID=884348 RepID=UPI0023027132|nr:prostasin isoform X2 [Hemicordylus capensis]
MGRLLGSLGVLLGLLFGCVVKESSTQVLCGTPAMGRIVGGMDAQSGQWPWQVNVNFDGHHVCGATLIASQWLITAAHCFPSINPIGQYEVTLGAFQLKNPSPDIRGRQVEQVIKHPDYTNDEGSKGDIALVKLKEPVSYSRTIRPICLPATSVSFPNGMKCTVTGWGNVLTHTSLAAPMTLQQLEVPIIGTDTCKCLYNRNPDPEDPHIIHSDMICAGFAEGKKDACQGDSGGPLSCYVDNAWLLAGVVSWGDACGQPNRPGVYISVSPYVDWIKENVRDATFTDVTVKEEPVSEEEVCSMAPAHLFVAWILMACWALMYIFGAG